MIIKKVTSYIEKNKLILPGDRLLVALSGGADSVALLRVLLDAGYSCEAAHCNFQLRGEESERDEAFVRELCDRLGIQLNYIRFDTKGFAAANGISIEMAARRLRYDWFESVRNDKSLNSIAVAHHRDDSAETILLNLIRGTGIHGLKGIRPRNGHIIRPLLSVSREEITNYLKSIDQAYVTDSTNLSDEFTRNKIRLQLIPLMETINPSVKETLTETGNRLSEVAVVYDQAIATGKSRVMSGNRIDIAALMREPSPHSLLFEILHPYGFTSSQLNDIFSSVNGQPGKLFVSNEWRIIKDRDHLLLSRLPDTDPLPPFVLETVRKEINADFSIPRDVNTACLDASLISLPLTTRKWEKGDMFIPFGMKGKKLVSDFLTDRKLSLPDKENQWVLCHGDDIVWVIGQRIDNRYRITSSSKEALIIRIKL